LRQINTRALQHVLSARHLVRQSSKATIDVGTQLSSHTLLHLGFAGESVGMKLAQQTVVGALQRCHIDMKTGLYLK